MPMIPISGFAPSVDPTTDGVSIDVTNLLPTNRGMRAALAGEAISPAAPETLLSAFSEKMLSGSARTFGMSKGKIFEFVGGAWNDVSRGGGYNTPAVNTWQICQFGDVTITTNGADPIQFSTKSGAFADLPGAPKAKIVESIGGFVMAFDTIDPANGDAFTDGWYCSGLYNHLAWDTSQGNTTFSASGRLFDTPGPIIAGKGLGSACVAYKSDSFYIGQFVGAPIIWQWSLVSAETGAYSQNAVLHVDATHYFMGKNGLWAFDGSRPQALGGLELKEWLRDDINPALTRNIRSVYDQRESLLYWFYPSNRSTGACDTALVYHLVTQKFGKVDLDVLDTVDLTLPDIPWGQLKDLFPTWTWPAGVTWNSSLYYGGDVGFAFIGADNRLYRGNAGHALPSSLETGDMGDDSVHALLTRVRPRFLKAPETASLRHLHKRNEGEVHHTGTTAPMVDSKFDLRSSDRFHKFHIDFTGEHEISAIDVTLQPNGMR
jgi:hypothetical protein